MFFLFFSSVFCLVPKVLNGPPSEFARHRQPAQVEAAESESSHLIPVVFDAAGTFEANILCDSSHSLVLSVLSPFYADWSVFLTDPHGKKVDLAPHYRQQAFPIADDGHFALPAHTFTLDQPSIGEFHFRAKGPAGSTGTLFVGNDSPLLIESFLTSYTLKTGAIVGLVTHVRSSVSAAQDLVAGAAITNAALVVTAPDGSREDYPMHDDGLGLDEVAGDGFYTAEFIPASGGNYLWYAQIQGTHADGTPFRRTTEHLVRVSDSQAQLSGGATAESRNGRLYTRLGVDNVVEGTQYHVYAELWTQTGQAIAWAASAPKVVDGKLELSFDARWLKNIDVRPGLKFDLRNVYITDVIGFVPLDAVDLIVIDPMFPAERMNELLVQAQARHPDEMHFGPHPLWLEEHMDSPQDVDASGHLVLVHGYCSSENPFHATPDAWTDATSFADYSANRLNNEFAEKIDEFVTAKGIKEWAAVGHSQGGIALTHLLCTYWSGLDATRMRLSRYDQNGTLAEPAPRLIQTVGTPFKGCTGAGSGASLAKSFGVGCGENVDLTPPGAQAWLAASVSAQCADHVHFYATKAKSSGFLPCSVATSLVLKSPNDGTTEVVYRELPGGHEAAPVFNGECHTSGMNYPAQTANKERAIAMNKLAARS